MDLAAADGHIAVASEAAADTCAIFSTGSRDLAASDLYLSVIGGASAADACTILSTGSLQTAVLIVVLNGQFAAGVGLVVFQAGMAAAAFQGVAAVQLNGGVAAAGHAHGGFVLASAVDVHILELDLHIVVLVLGVDGHGVGRGGVLLTICDDGVSIVFDRLFSGLLHLVGAGIGTCRDDDVAILNIIGTRKGGEGRPGKQGSGKGQCGGPLGQGTGFIYPPPLKRSTDGPGCAWPACGKRS